MSTFTITTPELPGAMFFGREALLRHAPERATYEAAVAAFAKDRDEITLSETLGALGYDAAEVAWHIARPGERMAEGFC